MNVIKEDEYKDQEILPSLADNIARIKEITGNGSDLLKNEFEIGGINACLFCCEGMISTSSMSDLIFYPLTHVTEKFSNSDELFWFLNTRLILSTDRPILKNYGDFFRALYSGFAIIVAEGQKTAMALGVQGYSVRGVDEPKGEANVFGAHDGFVETIRTNMSLVRRRMKSPQLRMELMQKGEKSKTDLCLCYLADRVHEQLLQEIKTSLDKIQLETILSEGYVRPFLESRKIRIFNSVGVTERPDVLCSKLLEGRVAVFVDGTPFTLVIPKLFNESFQTLDDYNCKPFYAVYIRWLKYIAFFIALFLPALYVAMAIHHPEQLNSKLLMILAESELNSPFPLVAEAFTVLIMYEIVREAGLRLPKAVGGAVSIVGGIIISDAAVTSGLVSTPLLTMVALSVISGFIIPDLDRQITVLRIFFLFAGGIFGLYGISLLGAAVLFNLCATEDYGFPVSAPISPFSKKAMRDIVTRVGFRKMQHGGFTVEKLK